MKMTKEDAVRQVRHLAPGASEEAIEWGAKLMGILAPACSTVEGASASWKKAVEASTRVPQAGVLRAAMGTVPKKPQHTSNVVSGTVIPPMPATPPDMPPGGWANG